ncbi:sugar kinase [Limobrevibacterium gyesilva]|uniref:Sugar kinase n=1 Tax=Limobrevibacterium gyesilva TaxID=2991712 RepID=A0AA41YSI9_9PROT|nr:sugar kinase [Limobrevibacterium gyesilva]
MTVDLVCMGEPMLEFNQQPATPDGRRLYLEGPGGDSSNAAVAAARQGARVAYVTALGRDPAGDRFIELWQAEGVDSSAVLRSAERPTAVYFVTHGRNGHEFLYYRRDSAAAAIGPADVPEAVIARAKIFFASGISQGISASAADAVFHAIAVARRNGVRVAYDTNYRRRLWPPARAAAVIHAAVAQADIALPSLEDAQTLTGLQDADAIADFYLRLGPTIVALKMGAAGALLATPDGRVRIPPFPCTPIDGTGAGDTFCGSFLARLIAGDAPEPAARYAAAAAALKTQGYGAVTPIPRAADVRAALGG